MASKCVTRENPIGLNQPPSREFKESITISKRYFKFLSDYIASQHTIRYPPDIPTPTIPDPTYSSSPDTPTQHKDSSSNEEI
jgi:hypothetical protein